MKISVGVKIFGVVVVLLILVGAAAWYNADKLQDIQTLIRDVHDTYIPAYQSLARANLRSVEEGLYARRLVIAWLQAPDDKTAIESLERATVGKSRDADTEFAAARRIIGREISDSSSLEDKPELARLDTRLEFLQGRHRDYEAVLTALEAAIEKGDAAEQKRQLDQLDQLRDAINNETETARVEMRGLLDAAIHKVEHGQSLSVQIGLALLALALLLGAVTAAVITVNLVRSLRRLLHGTALVQQGALDTEVPVTSRDEVGELTAGFNAMVRELRDKARIRETFGRYLDPRIVEGLIDQPDRLAGTGDRREMTVFFCDMQGFTNLSEGMTPAGMVRIVNRYLALMSEPVRRNQGIIDKYIGDGIMAFWGPPFSQAEDQARLACAAGIEQFAAFQTFRAELPDLTGFRRGVPHIDMRIGVATGEVIVGNIGSDVSMSYTVMGDAVNFASRVEGANKVYGTRFLVNARTAEMASDAIVFREIDRLVVEGKQEPELVFEVLGRKGEISPAIEAMAERFAEGLAAYRERSWRSAIAAFDSALEAVPEDGPSRVFRGRAQRLEIDPPPPDWKGEWTLHEK
jgi:class 3 adenylate cyclase